MLFSHVHPDPNAALASHQILPSNPRRKTITFYASRTANVTLSNDSPAVADLGIPLPAGGAPLYFDVDFHGECVQQEWYAVYVGGTAAVGIVEALF